MVDMVFLYINDIFQLGAVASGEVKSAILQHQLLQAKTEPEKLAVLAKYEEMVQVSG